MGPGGVGLGDAEVPAESGEEIIPNIRDLAWRLLRLHMEVGRAERMLVACLAECDRMAAALGQMGAAVGQSRGAEGARTGCPAQTCAGVAHSFAERSHGCRERCPKKPHRRRGVRGAVGRSSVGPATGRLGPDGLRGPGRAAVVSVGQAARLQPGT